MKSQRLYDRPTTAPQSTPRPAYPLPPPGPTPHAPLQAAVLSPSASADTQGVRRPETRAPAQTRVRAQRSTALGRVTSASFLS